MYKQFQSLRLSFARFEAVDGSRAHHTDGHAAVSPLCRHLLCNNGVRGCAQSHIALWRALVASSDRACVIMEDDIILPGPEFIDTLQPVRNALDTDTPTIINFACIGPLCTGSERVALTCDRQLVRSVFPLGLGAYALNRSAASSLLDAIQCVTYHVDFEVAAALLADRRIKCFSVSPSLVSTHRQDTSIGSRHSFSLFLGWNGTLMWYANVPVLRYISLYGLALLVLVAVLLVCKCYVAAAVAAFEFAVFSLS